MNTISKEEVIADVFSSYNNIVSKIPLFEFLDETVESNGTSGWAVYYIPSTIIRFYIYVEFFEDENLTMNIEISIEIDPDFSEDLKYRKYRESSFISTIEDIDVAKYIGDDGVFDTSLAMEIYKKIETSVEKQIDDVQVILQSIFKDIEEDLINGENIKKTHKWIAEDWIEVDKMIKLSRLTIKDILKTLEYFDLLSDSRFVPAEVRDIFLF